jgi:hypothetical protein
VSKKKNEEDLSATTNHLVSSVKEKEEVVDLSIDVLEDVKPDISRRILTEYDPNARNPCYSGAELSFSYELMALSNHFHPSVALFAQTLTKRKTIKYDGNPFKDFTLTRFLERFSYRNAKPITVNIECLRKEL